MLGATLEEEDLAVLENDLGFDLAVAGRADGEGDVVEEVRASLGHGNLLSVEVITAKRSKAFTAEGAERAEKEDQKGGTALE